MANYQRPRLPSFAHELARHIVQFHSFAYRNPAPTSGGPVLVVGAGNSGAGIAEESVRHGHQTWLAGRTGVLPFRIDGLAARLFGTRFFLGVLFHRVLTIRTPLGRFLRPKMLHRAAPLVRLKPKDLEAAGVHARPASAASVTVFRCSRTTRSWTSRT